MMDQIFLKSVSIGGIVLVAWLTIQFAKFFRWFLKFPRTPGPAGFPVIGSLLPIIEGALCGNITKVLQNAAKCGSVSTIWITMKPIVILSSLPLIRDVLQTALNNYQAPHTVKRSDTQTGSHAHVFGKSTLFTAGPEWKWRRNMVTPLFQPRSLNAVAEPAITRLSQQLLQDLRVSAEAKRSVDIDLVLVEFTCNIITAVTFGSEFEWQNTKAGSARRVVECITEMNDSAIAQTALLINTPFSKSKQLLRDSILPVIREFYQRNHDSKAKCADSDSVLSNTDEFGHPLPLLEQLSRNERFDEDALFTEAIALLLAGTETTAHTLAFALYELAKSSEYQERLHAEAVDVFEEFEGWTAITNITSAHLNKLVFTNAIIKETLRLYPSVGFTFVKVISPINLGGYIFPVDTEIAINYSSVFLDPDLFPDPLAFKPERWLDETTREIPELWFSIGAHQCLGRSLAIAEAKTVLSLLSRSFFFHPAKDHPMKIRNFGLLKPQDGVYINFVERKK